MIFLFQHKRPVESDRSGKKNRHPENARPDFVGVHDTQVQGKNKNKDNQDRKDKHRAEHLASLQLRSEILPHNRANLFQVLVHGPPVINPPDPDVSLNSFRPFQGKYFQNPFCQ